MPFFCVVFKLPKALTAGSASLACIWKKIIVVVVVVSVYFRQFKTALDGMAKGKQNCLTHTHGELTRRTGIYTKASSFTFSPSSRDVPQKIFVYKINTRYDIADEKADFKGYLNLIVWCPLRICTKNFNHG